MSPRRDADGAALAGVFALWGLAVALVGVGGNFPLSDDWAYGHVVRSLLVGRGFDLLPWTGASLVAQALLGAAACKLTGFSWVTLRLTTLAMSAVGLAAFHALLRELGADRRAAAAAATLLAFSPLWFNLSFTFMTDVPFAVVALVAAWLYVRALGASSRSGLLAASAVCAAAFLIRQHGIWIALAAALALLLPVRGPRGPRFGSRAGDAAAAVTLPLLVALAYSRWATSAGAPLAVHNKIGEVFAISLLPIAGATFRALATLGFLYLPWVLATPPIDERTRRLFVPILVLLGAVGVFVFVREGDTMFYLTNVLSGWSVGALTTRDTLFLAQAPAAPTNVALAVMLTAASLASAAALVSSVACGAVSSWQRGDRPALFCVLALVLSALGTLVQAHYYFDRYLVVLLPLAVAASFAIGAAARPGAAFAAALAAFAIYSVAGTHDYLAWNRARWDLLNSLEARGVAASSIDGGVEYNAERLAATLRTAPNDAQARSGQDASAKSWWWVIDDAWIISFSPLDGYRQRDERPWTRWLPPGEGRVLALEREQPAATKR